MQLKWLWKDRDSKTGNCPALYRVSEPNGYVAQGKKLDAQTRAQLRELGADEDAIFIPANVLDRLREL